MKIKENRHYDFYLTAAEHDLLRKTVELLYSLQCTGETSFYNWFCEKMEYNEECMNIDSFETLGDFLRDIEEFADVGSFGD